MKLSLLFTLIFIININAQSDTTFSIDLLKIEIDGGNLKVKNPAEKVIFSQKFNAPSVITNDLDSDGVEELIVIDNYLVNNKKEYTLYTFSTVDSFYLAATVNSGYLEPYIQSSEEISADIIITGLPEFNFLNDSAPDIFYPLICWRYDNGQLFNDDIELYDIYLNENDAITDFLDDYYETNSKNCTATLKVKNAVASVYLNFLSADEEIMANQFIKNYYFCDDYATFKSKLDSIKNKEE